MRMDLDEAKRTAVGSEHLHHSITDSRKPATPAVFALRTKRPRKRLPSLRKPSDGLCERGV
jgi:hypothetical protein